MIALRKLRRMADLTQGELSKLLEVSISTIGMWETGQREPGKANLKKLAELYGVTCGYLLGVEPERGSPGETNTAYERGG